MVQSLQAVHYVLTKPKSASQGTYAQHITEPAQCAMKQSESCTQAISDSLFGLTDRF